MSESISFTVLGTPHPQGSAKIVNRAKFATITSDNPKLYSFRQEVGWCALRALEGRQQPFAAKHVPVELTIRFHFRKPPSVPKKRAKMVVKPDLDKLTRACCDAMTGIMWQDDAQIVCLLVEKDYSDNDHAEFIVTV